MGKKSKTGNSGKLKLSKKKLDPSLFPEPLPELADEIGSLRLLDKPQTPGSLRKNVGVDGYDDGGVGDLKLAIDLDDHVMRRKRGESNFVMAVQTDSLPRLREGQFKTVYRRDQKVQLAQILFSEDGGTDTDVIQNPTNTSEVYTEVNDERDEETKKKFMDSLRSAKFALRLSIILKEPACICLSLAEISKRYLACYGKEGAEDARRCAMKGIEIATSEYYDVDEMAIEGEDKPEVKAHEKEPTYPGLVNKGLLQYMPLRVSTICLRSVYLHAGNAISALGKDDEAREQYVKSLPILEKEPRSSRLDWERSSFLVNIGNTHSRQGEYDKANEFYYKAEKLGQDQCEVGAMVDGLGLIVVSLRARAFALKRVGKEAEGKAAMREVLSKQVELDKELVKHREELKEAMEAVRKEESEAAPVAPSGEIAAQG
jgi:tetratricopeptide (TPR) repeat protein